MFLKRFTTEGSVLAYAPASLCFSDAGLDAGGTPPPVDPAAVAPPEPPASEPPAAPPAEPTGAEPPPAAPPAPKRLSLQEKFERSTAKRIAAEAKAAELQARLDALEAARAEPAKPAEPNVPEPARPDRAAFTNPDDYEAALVEWSSEKAARKVAAALEAKAKQDDERRAAEDAERTRRTAADTEAGKVRDAFMQRRAAFIEAHPDYAELVEADPEDGGPTISAPMAQAIVTADNGPAVGYWLANNIEESERIAALPPVRQIIEIGRIAERLVTPAAKPPTTPPPINPLRSAAAATARKSPDEESMDEYAVRRAAEMRTRH